MGTREDIGPLPATADDVDPSAWFDTFLSDSSDRLRRGFVVRYGVEIGTEVHGDVLAWAVGHTTELASMRNPLGYLFRVGQSESRRHRRWARVPVTLPRVDQHHDPVVEPGLPAALERLRPTERTAVVLVHSFSWTYDEVADLLGVPVSTVTNLVHRGVGKLRRSLGVTT